MGGREGGKLGAGREVRREGGRGKGGLKLGGYLEHKEPTGNYLNYIRTSKNQ